jgi:hypothetical protein
LYEVLALNVTVLTGSHGKEEGTKTKVADSVLGVGGSHLVQTMEDGNRDGFLSLHRRILI